jgi:hypothetical protein
MKRLVVLLPLAALFAVAAPASANAPDRVYVPTADLGPTTGICAFPVQITVLANNGYFTTFYDKAGNVTKGLSSGHITVRITNVSTGYSVTRNITGPGFWTFTSNGLTIRAEGPWLFVFFPGEVVSGAPGRLLYTTGRVFFSPSSSPETWRIVGGTVEDLCVTLAH